jgi:peptidoglycan/xylan/chitin deacetylase (PgdA/CDA1 family)
MIPVLAGAAVLSAAGVFAYGVRHPASTLFAPSVHRGPKTRRAIALTFDDGPTPMTPKLLEILTKHGAKATFFQCGAQVERNPQIAREIASLGFEIANHTQTHPAFYFKAPAFMRDEVARAQRAIEQAIGQSPRWFRPPYGIRWPGLGEVLRQHHLQGVMWTVIGHDWRLDAKAVAERVRSDIGPGSIVCLHDGRGLAESPDITSTIEATRVLVPELLQHGFRLETVSDLLCPTN